MSHMTKAETKITNCKESLLVETVERIAKEEGLTVTKTIKDYYNKDHKVTIGLTGPGLHRGIGFNIEAGKLSTFGDQYQQSGYQDIQSKVVQGYVQTATVRTLGSLGYRTQTRTKQGEKIVLTMVGP